MRRMVILFVALAASAACNFTTIYDLPAEERTCIDAPFVVPVSYANGDLTLKGNIVSCAGIKMLEVTETAIIRTDIRRRIAHELGAQAVIYSYGEVTKSIGSIATKTRNYAAVDVRGDRRYLVSVVTRQ